jgi:osmotically-inducible protein OsmY
VVTSISGNTVTLIGHVRTEAQRDAVVRAAWRGHAVMAVVDQIEITG